ncbi:MAG: glycoside hydrolase [Bacteroidetes bacterium GWF2_42_66]|nr:MAG: glycoside hydrolase [Bacteroidetes bacterium GWA2_42_15]OFY03152.1 MAG: glycoside hydrolase [Bacteroidetes bacterium GWE2_42_39]OFY45260.1 MAG: glycoside hydrolase [Bacteroidetes bacterium GWF2_42_66]
MFSLFLFNATISQSSPKTQSAKKIKPELNILAFGANGDGKTLNTTAIQSAIDNLASKGGGRLIIPEGRFLSGSIILKSGIELHLQQGAVLLGSTNPYHYKGINRWKALILADGQTRISISGKGTIDGQGRRLALNADSLYYIGEMDAKYYNLRRKRPNEYFRPQNIEMVNCKNIHISGVTIQNAACWVQTYDLCENLVLDSIRVISDAYWNNDGIDISDCRNVRVTNSFVNSADDGICLKSHATGHWNDSIYIANCTVRSSASAVKFGTASTGGFKNVKIENINVYDTFRSAIALESVDGGILENIDINNIVATNTGNAIFIRLGHRNTDERYSQLRNVTIRNVKVEIPFDRPDSKYEMRGPDLPFFHNPFPCSITGIPGHPIENVTLENIEISFPGRGNDGMAIIPLSRLKDVPEVEAEYPEFSMFGELPAWGFYVRHVEGLTMKNISIQARDKDYRPAFVFDDVKALKMEKIKMEEPDSGLQMILNKTREANLKVSKQLVKVLDNCSGVQF